MGSKGRKIKHAEWKICQKWLVSRNEISKQGGAKCQKLVNDQGGAKYVATHALLSDTREWYDYHLKGTI